MKRVTWDVGVRCYDAAAEYMRFVSQSADNVYIVCLHRARIENVANQ